MVADELPFGRLWSGLSPIFYSVCVGLPCRSAVSGDAARGNSARLRQFQALVYLTFLLSSEVLAFIC